MDLNLNNILLPSSKNSWRIGKAQQCTALKLTQGRIVIYQLLLLGDYTNAAVSFYTRHKID